MWVKGSGSDLATMGPQHFTGLKLDEVVPLIERAEDERRGDGRLPVALHARPRRCRAASIETLLHAFVPAAARAPHAPGRDQRAGRARRTASASCTSASATAAAWIPYIRPGFTLSKQVGEAARSDPDLKLVVLAKHGLVVWGDTAEEAYRRTIEVINQAVAFANERTGRHPALRRQRIRPRAR